jgi:autotransporter-associated beta strand protein
MRLSRQHLALVGAATVAAFLSLPPVAAHAVDATWNLNATGEFNNNLNWTPTQVPTGTASFGASNTTSVTINTATSINYIQINAGAPAYTFTISNALNIIFQNFIGGGNIINNSSFAPTFNITSNGSLSIDSGAANAIIVNNGTLLFNGGSAENATITNNNKLQFVGNATGAAARLIQSAAGQIDLSGLHCNFQNCSNNTTAGSIEGAGTISLGSFNLAVGGNNLSTTFSGSIQDGGANGGTGGSLTKVGTGTLTLSGNNAYTGATIINGGTLVVDGKISSNVQVNSVPPPTSPGGGTLAGTGTIVGNTQVFLGTVAPGNTANPTGTLTFNGNLQWIAPGSVYVVHVNSTSASFINVTGSSDIDGITVQAVFDTKNPLKRYNIYHSPNLGGILSQTLQTSNLPPGFTASLSYSPKDPSTGNFTDMFLNVTAALGGPQQATGLSSTHLSVATAINNFFNDPPLPPAFLPLFSLTGGDLTSALSQLSGEVATGAQQPAFQLTNQFLNIMLDPFVDGRGNPIGGSAIGFAPEREELPDDVALAYAKILKAPPKPQSFDQPWSVWGAGYGGSNRTTGESIVAGSHDLAASTAGGAAGLDYRLAPGTVVGFALAGGGTNWSLAQALGGGKSDAFQAGLYGTARSGAAYVAAAFAFTNHWMSTDRFAFAGDHLSANFNAQSYGGRVESGYRVATYYGGFTPYAAIQSQTFHTPGYSETDLNGGGFALGFDSRNATDTRSELGGRFDRLLLLNPEAALTLRARVAWAHDWVSDPALTAAFQMLPGADTSFIVNGATPAKNSALVSEGVELRLANGVVLLGKFDGEFASHSTTYAGTGTVRYTW